MLQGINIDEIKKYNASLKQYKDQSAALAAEIQFNEKELNSLCEQLSTELGVQVTAANIEQIYEEQVSKIQTALQTGNTILQKIEQESQNPIGTLPNMGVQTPVQPVTPVPPVVPGVGVVNTAPQLTQPGVTPSAPIFSSAPVETPDSLPPLNASQPFFKMS